MNITLILILVLVVCIGLFICLCITRENLRVDAAYVVGFCVYFDLFGYLYKQVMPGNALVLLLAVPFIPVCIALFSKGSKSWDFLRDQGVWLWGLVFLYALGSLIWAPYETAGLNKLLILFIHAVVPGIYTYILYKKYNKFSWTVLALFGFAFAAAHLTLGEYSQEYPGRLVLPGGNPIYNARMSLFTVTVCLWGRNIPLWIRIPVIAIAGASAIATESRGPIAAFAVANLIIGAVVLFNKYKQGKLHNLKGIVLAFLAVIVLGIFAGLPYSAELKQWVEGSRFSVLFDRQALMGDDNMIGRLVLQEKAIATWNEHPFIGAGIGSVTPPLAHDFPHNVLLEIVSELGVVGMTLWTLAYLYSLWAGRQFPVVMVLLLQTLGSALMSGDFGYNFEYLLMSFVALMLVPEKEQKGGEEDAKNLVPHYRA